MAAPLWALVLSENCGLRPDGMLGGVPRALWTPGGGAPSTLGEALSRMAALVPAPRTVTVIGPTQRAAASALRDTIDPGYVIRQPGDRGTAPGVLLGLAAMLEVRPDAIVAITPVTYGVHDRDQFQLSIRHAAAWVRNQDDIVVFGATPTSRQSVPGWTTPDRTRRINGPRVMRPVDSLVDRPGEEDVAELLTAHALWNSEVVVARARTLFDIYDLHLPYMVEMLQRVLGVAGRDRAARLDEEYRGLRPAEFSRDVLARADSLMVYAWPASIGYTPISSPERLEAWQRQIAREGREGGSAGTGWGGTSTRRAFGG
jgi:mannose-1-phosphate guanylyltransferase